MILVGDRIDHLRRARRSVIVLLACAIALLVGGTIQGMSWWLTGLACGQASVWWMLLLEVSREIRAAGPYKLPEDR